MQAVAHRYSRRAPRSPPKPQLPPFTTKRSSATIPPHLASRVQLTLLSPLPLGPYRHRPTGTLKRLAPAAEGIRPINACDSAIVLMMMDMALTRITGTSMYYEVFADEGTQNDCALHAQGTVLNTRRIDPTTFAHRRTQQHKHLCRTQASAGWGLVNA